MLEKIGFEIPKMVIFGKSCLKFARTVITSIFEILKRDYFQLEQYF